MSRREASPIASPRALPALLSPECRHALEFDPRCPQCQLVAAAAYREVTSGRVCVLCGCTDLAACPGGCSWVETDGEDDVCSACAEKVGGTSVEDDLEGGVR